MEEFSETFKHEHPNYKSFAIVGKAGGEKWRSMSPAERGVYEAKAEARRTHYINSIQASDEDESDSDDSEEVVDDSLPDTVEPRRPASAFFCFLDEFRHTYKSKHPNNKSVSAVGKAGGDKWRSLSDAEKAPYVAEAEKRKAEYNKYMDPYCKKMIH
ncbi:HMG1/2-like protein isoform X1 [Papaver somniferum]|uniref:HMG1/2-like protein isoform X1 n=1 Tax=Papaver somniferum TaxID=3469 RepID=UPI000E6F9214|nr:HMG1/2-like protein isoform X1 [Papaver somniferum]